MANVKVKLNSSGVRELLKSSEIQNYCVSLAESRQSAMGDGYEVQTRNYPERSGAIIVATSSKAKKDNLENNTLLKGAT
jgi:hypothetical protein